MPRRNYRPERRPRRAEQPITDDWTPPPMTPEQLAADLVRRGLASLWVIHGDHSERPAKSKDAEA